MKRHEPLPNRWYGHFCFVATGGAACVDTTVVELMNACPSALKSRIMHMVPIRLTREVVHAHRHKGFTLEGDTMPRGSIPDAFHDLLESTAFASVSTLGRTGEPQVNPVWFLWTGTQIQIGLMPGTQKCVNLVRDQRIEIAIAHPDNPYSYLEVRGHTGPLEPDVDDAVFNAVSTKYTGAPFSLEDEGTARFVATVIVARYTFQDSDGIPTPT